MKKCCKCKQSLLLNCFTKDRSSNDGISRRCKTCASETRKQYAPQRRAYARKAYRENPVFNKRAKESAKQWREKNREKYRKWQADHRQENREKYKEKNLLRLYGIDRNGLDKMWNQQSGRCACCNTELTKQAWAIDHDHNTGQVRGLLCNSCNLGLGMFSDSVIVFLKAARYLLKTGCIEASADCLTQSQEEAACICKEIMALDWKDAVA